jgi:hypothetical protein
MTGKSEKVRRNGAANAFIDARIAAGILVVIALALPASAEVQSFPANFHNQEIQTDGATIHVRVGGQGPAVVLLHGFGDTGDMWAPMAAEGLRYAWDKPPTKSVSSGTVVHQNDAIAGFTRAEMFQRIVDF